MRNSAIVLCILLIPSLLPADVTLLYKTETKLSPSLPPALMQGLNASRAMTAPAERMILIKGGKFYATTALLGIIADLPNDKLTLLDSTNKHYATIPVSQYTDQIAGSMPQLPAGVKGIVASMKLTTDSRVTGRTAEIQGIQAEEHEIVLSLGLPPGPNGPSTPMIKLVMQLWLAKPEEVTRNPALQEFVASGFQTLGGMNPAESIQKIMGQFPGISDGLSSYMKEVTATHSATLRIHGEVFMPIFAMLAQRVPAVSNALGSFDPNVAVMEMNKELVEISTAPVSDAVFQIPEGYTPVPFSEIMSAMQPKAAAAARHAIPAQLPDGTLAGNGYTPPSVIQRSKPVYSDEAKAKKIAGSVLLSVLVGTDGKASDIRIVRSLDPELDRSAIDAVGRWVFSPAIRDGAPVAARARIEINFKPL